MQGAERMWDDFPHELFEQTVEKRIDKEISEVCDHW
jgi:hypothetical protein